MNQTTTTKEKYICKRKEKEKNELTAYSMAKHPNWVRVLRTTRADIKKTLLWTGDYWNEWKYFPKMRVSGWLLTRWLAGWLTGRSWCYYLLIIYSRTTKCFSVSIYLTNFLLSLLLQNLHEKKNGHDQIENREKESENEQKIYTFTVIEFLRGTYLIVAVRNAVTHSKNDNWNYFCVLLFLYCCYPTIWNVIVGKLCLLEINRQ